MQDWAGSRRQSRLPTSYGRRASAEASGACFVWLHPWSDAGVDGAVASRTRVQRRPSVSASPSRGKPPLGTQQSP